MGPVLVPGCGAVGTWVGAGGISSGGACAPSAAWPSVWGSPSLPTDLLVLDLPPFGLSASSSTFGRSSSAMSSGSSANCASGSPLPLPAPGNLAFAMPPGQGAELPLAVCLVLTIFCNETRWFRYYLFYAYDCFS